jgi:hypothetical protein
MWMRVYFSSERGRFGHMPKGASTNEGIAMSERTVTIKGEFKITLELEDLKKLIAENVVVEPAPKLSDEAQDFVSESDYNVT